MPGHKYVVISVLFIRYQQEEKVEKEPLEEDEEEEDNNDTYAHMLFLSCRHVCLCVYRLAIIEGHEEQFSHVYIYCVIMMSEQRHFWHFFSTTCHIQLN